MDEGFRMDVVSLAAMSERPEKPEATDGRLQHESPADAVPKPDSEAVTDRK